MKEQVFSKYPLVQIEWKDAQSDSEWTSVEKIQKWATEDCIIFEIGWVIYENEDYLIISNQIGEDGDLGNRTKIPKTWIRKKDFVSTVRKK